MKLYPAHYDSDHGLHLIALEERVISSLTSMSASFSRSVPERPRMLCKSPKCVGSQSVCSAFRWADIRTACQPNVQGFFFFFFFFLLLYRRNRPTSNVLRGDNNLWENDVTQRGRKEGGRTDRGATRAAETQHITSCSQIEVAAAHWGRLCNRSARCQIGEARF